MLELKALNDLVVHVKMKEHMESSQFAISLIEKIQGS